MSYTNPVAFKRRRVAVVSKTLAITAASSVVMMASFATMPRANAQQADQAATIEAIDDQSIAIEEVLITGSRIVRDGYESPTPVTVLGIEEIQQAPAQHISDFIRQLPSFGGTAASTTGGGNDISNGRQSQNNLNLRGLDVYRTLVLLDGHRFVSGDSNLAVNINDIPQSLVSSVDIVTGGASAVYGSDAVAGVVNFVLDTDYEGFKGEVQGGVTNESDNASYRVNLTYGSSFAGGRGHVIVSGDYARNDGIFGANGARDWGFDTAKIIANPDYNADTNSSVPAFLVRNQVATILATPGGIITTGPLAGTTFDQNGNLGQYNYGSLTNSQFTVGGDWDYSDVTKYNQSLANKVERQNFFGRVSYDLTDDINVYFNLIQGDTYGFARSKLDDSLGNITINADNPYMNPELAAQVANLGLSSFKMGSFNLDMPPISTDTYRRVWSYSLGLDGTSKAFGKEWDWQVFGQYGLAKSTLNGNVFNRGNFARALDSVRNSSGQIVCRVNADADSSNDDALCKPWNPFGWNNNDELAIGYSKGLAQLKQENRQTVFSVSANGEPFSVWAGPVSVATGMDWRKEEITGVVDEGSLTSSYTAGNYKPTIGSYTVGEVYLETLIPLLNGKPWAESLDFNGAVRGTNYSTSGYVTTWKLGITYRPVDSVMFRLTKSRDIRAPNLEELYAGGRGGQSPGILDPFNNNEVLPTFLGNQIGNTDLDPEIADTTGIGVVWQPSFLPGFSASVDYYDININGAISVIGSQETLNRCYAGEQELCDRITRNEEGVITEITSSPFNAINLHQRGIDIESTYVTSLSDFVPSWKGDITLRALGTHVMFSKTDDGLGGPVEDNAGNLLDNGIADWRWQFSARYSLDRFSLAWTGKYISSGNYGPTYLQCDTGSCPVSNGSAQTIDENHIDSMFTQDLAISYDFLQSDSGASAQLYFIVANVFNTKPPQVANPRYWYMPVNPRIHDVIGRQFYAGIRFDM